jgi:hypothetical protein
MGDIPHGTVSYNIFAGGEAWYMPPVGFSFNTRPVIIRLVPNPGDTDESWFKIGGADAIADQLIAQKRGKSKSFILTTAPVKGAIVKVLRADDYNTWEERRQALEKLLTR